MCVCCITTLFFMTACVSEEYNLDKGIDTSGNVLPGLSVPIGNVNKVQVADLLDFELSDNSLVYPDDNGDFVMEYSINDQFDVNGIDIGFDDALRDKEMFSPLVVDFPVSSAFLPEMPGMDLSYSDLTGSPLSLSTEINFDVDFPEEVLDIKSVEFSYMNFRVDVRSDGQDIHLKSGFRIKFPENIYLAETYADLDIEDDHTLVLLNDRSLPSILMFEIVRIDVPEGAYTDGRFLMNSEIQMEGDFYINTDSLKDVSDDIQVTLSGRIIDLITKGAELKVDCRYELEDIEMEIEDIPDFLTSEETVLDIYNPSLYISIDNSYQFRFGLSASINSYMLDGHTESINIGTDPEIIVNKDHKAWYVISRREMQLPEGLVGIVDPGMGDMFRTIPEKLAVRDINVDMLPSDDFQWFDLNPNRYIIPYYFRLNLPLAFGEDLNFETSLDMDMDDVDIDAFSDHAVLKMDIVNSIPMSFDLEVEAIDSDSNPVDGVEFEIETEIASGTHLSPVATPVTLNITTNGGDLKFSGLRLNIHASAPSQEHMGVTLNQNQGLELKNVVFYVPDGITIK